MFEKILEKVLVSYFGRFISGLDKNNLKLGVWSGNVVIENVNLKPEVIEMLELPFKLKQSSISKMSFKIPWKKLSSSPVEITIDTIHVTVNQLPPDEWNFSDQIIIEKKFQLMMEYCKDCMKRGLQKQKKKKKGDDDQELDPGYLDKMAIKIIDNIQLKITNIHFRWEYNGQDSTSVYKLPHSWGVTLESLEISTTDEKWRKFFMDRTEAQNKLIPMNKLFSMTNLALYWNSHDKLIEPETMSKEKYFDYMDIRIYKQEGETAQKYAPFIIRICSEVKVIQNAPKQFFLPLYDLNVQLDQLRIYLQKDQFK